MTKQDTIDESRSSLENGNDTNEKPSIWASILRDVKSSTKTAPATKTLVVLGDNESGRTTLVAKLQGNDDPKRGAGLEYHYIDVKDDDRDDTPKLGVWILDGDVACSAPLLKFAIKSDTLDNTLLILVASMTHPWLLLSTLKKWTALLEEHIDRLKIDPIRLRDMRDRLQSEFQHYVEPNDTSIMLTSSTSTATLKSGAGGSRVPNSISSVSLASTATLSPTINGDEQVVLPLPDGVLTKSLGIPVIVVITKCDVMPTLEKENDYKDEYFDFMQYHLRKFCLEYGAALFYTSIKEKKNIDKLYKYIVYKCYGYPFTSTAAIVERDSIFIPAGWDNPKKADILLENLHRLKPTDNYSDVFVKPIVRRPLQRDNEIIAAEDDQEFLAKLQLTLNRAASPGRADETATPVHTRTSGVSGGIGSQTPSVAGRSRNQPSTTPGGANTAANEGALANFFNSLLTRKSGGAVTPTGGTTPGAQRQTSQSPTTPSSKRLQQHPLTFAVTPPPGRTRTPTSHKPFASPLNTESPPRLLSPLVEQQSKGDSTSTSPTVVRTPLEDNETIKTFDTNENKQSSIPNIESVPVNHNEKQSNDTSTTEHESVVNEDQLKSQHDSNSNFTHNSDTKTLNSPSLLSPLTENKLDVAQVAAKDVSHSENSESTTDHSFSAIQSRPISPSQSNELASTENDNNLLLTNQSESSSPAMNNDNKLSDRSASIEHNSFSLSTSLNPENNQQISPTGTQNEIFTSTLDDISSIDSKTEQQDDLKQSLNSSRRNSEIKSFSPSLSSSSIANESHQQDEQLEQQPLSSDERTSKPLIQSRPISPTTLETSEMPTTNQEPLNSLSFDTQQIDDANISKEGLPESSLAHELPISVSTSNVNTNELEQQNISLPTENGQRKSSIQETLESTFPIAENPGSTEADQSPTFETGDIKFDSHETTTGLPSVEEKFQRSRSPSPNIEGEQTRSRAASSLIEQENKRSRSPSPTIEQKEQRSRSPSPSIKPEQEPDRSTSPVLEQNQVRSRSPSPIIKDKEQRSRSPSPSIEQEQQPNQSVSPFIEQSKERSRSPSPIRKPEEQRSRSPSPSIKRESELNRSDSSIVEQNSARSRSLSPITQHDQQRSRSPSPSLKGEPELIRSASPVIEEDRERSRSSSPIMKQEEQRSRSPSPSIGEKPELNQSTYVIEETQEQIRSPSPVTHHEQQRSRSPSPVMKQGEQRSRSPSPSLKGESELRRSASLIVEQNQERSRSPSPATKQEEQRSRSSSPIIEQNPERSRSPSPIIKHEKQRSRSPSPSIGEKPELNQSAYIIQETEEQNRSPSPITLHEQQRSRSPSPVMKQDEQRSRSPSPSLKGEPELSRSASPIVEQNQERSRSPSPVTKQEEQRSRSSSPSIGEKAELNQPASYDIEENPEGNQFPAPTATQEEQRSHSPSLSLKEEAELSRSASPIVERNEERSRSLSPIMKQEEHRSRSPPPSIGEKPELNQPAYVIEETEEQNRSSSPITHHEQQRSRSPSPSTKQEEQRSRSPSPNIKRESELRRSPSPVMKQDEQRSRSPSPSLKGESKLSRSASLIVEQNQERSRSPSPAMEQEEQRSRSPSPSLKGESELNRSASLIVEQNQERSRSPSPTMKQEEQRSRSPSPSIGQKIELNQSAYVIEDSQEPNRSPSPISQHEQQRSRSPSPGIGEEPYLNRAASPSIEQSQVRSRSPSPITQHEQQRSRSPSPSIEQEQEQEHNLNHSASPTIEQNDVRSQSPLPFTNEEQQRSRSPSPINEQKERRSQSILSTEKQNQQRSRSPSPLIEENRDGSRSGSPIGEKNQVAIQSASQEMHERSRSVSPVTDQSKLRSRSPSFNMEQNEERSPIVLSPDVEEQKGQRSRSKSSTSEQDQQSNQIASPSNGEEQQKSRSSSLVHEDSLLNASSDFTNEVQSINETISSPNTDSQQEHKFDSLASPINESQSQYPFEQPNHNTLNSPSSKASFSSLISPTNFNYEIAHNFNEPVTPTKTNESEQQVRSRSSSFKNEDQVFDNEKNKSNEINTNDFIVDNINEQLQKSPLSSPLIAKEKNEALNILSPAEQHETSFIKAENENQISPIASPSSTLPTEDPSTQALKSPVNGNISSTTPEKPKKVSLIPVADEEPTNFSEINEPSPSIEHSSIDHSHGSDSSAFLKSSINRQASITRSQSQSTLARPNTLHFSPNDHNLDGLYTSNDYNDEDEIVEDNEYHRHSAPTTVSGEDRRSSILSDSNHERRHSPVNPNDILQRLSMIEKSRIEDNENSVVDSTPSKDT
ncbi:unnamed protein product [Adineta steineri]|uniref:Dynein light intermediate chain n=1 Tax=Adineta steineri TaxID=433720 RepID=A0A815M000_9BILA|nr:unnamed protein product [Adineta steineri]